MKPYKISIFIFSVIACLALVAWAYPEDGIAIGDATLTFPTLSEFFSQDEQPTEPELTPEELLALRAQELRQQQEDSYMSYFRENEAAIHFPAGDSLFEYFDPLFAALDGADTAAVRIVHYGDSQIEEDRISDVLRKNLQAKFGGQGVGTVPMYQSVASRTISHSCEYEPTRYSIFWLKSLRREGSRMYGPMGQVSVVNSPISISFSARAKQDDRYSAHYFNTLTLLTSSQNTITATIKGNTKTIEGGESHLRFTEFDLADSTTNVSVRLSGQGDVYGIMLTGKTGVNVDNIAMRGCSGTIFTGIDATQLRDYFAYTNTKLIILQFGGNSVPYLKTTKAIETYANNIVNQIKFIQRQAPEAKILFIGPSDMSTRINGKMQTYPWLEDVDKALMKAATENDCAYWSMFKSMGGNDAMAQWVRSGLAGKDYIHFTRKGANEVGELLSNSILACYNYYSWRQREQEQLTKIEPEKETLSTDSIHLPEIKLSPKK